MLVIEPRDSTDFEIDHHNSFVCLINLLIIIITCSLNSKEMVTASVSVSWQPSASMDYVSEHTDVSPQEISRYNTINTMSKQHELEFDSIVNDNCKIYNFSHTSLSIFP